MNVYRLVNKATGSWEKMEEIRFSDNLSPYRHLLCNEPMASLSGRQSLVPLTGSHSTWQIAPIRSHGRGVTQVTLESFPMWSSSPCNHSHHIQDVGTGLQSCEWICPHLFPSISQTPCPSSSAPLNYLSCLAGTTIAKSKRTSLCSTCSLFWCRSAASARGSRCPWPLQLDSA